MANFASPPLLAVPCSLPLPLRLFATSDEFLCTVPPRPVLGQFSITVILTLPDCIAELNRFFY